MEDDELRLHHLQLPLLPPIPSPSIAPTNTSAPLAVRRRASVTATLNDGPDMPSPRLALFASPLLPQEAGHTQTPPDKRRRRLRSSIVHKQLRTPRSLKLQHFAHSSPFHLTSPVHHLSLLSPSHNVSHIVPSVQSRTEPQSPSFLHPLTHMSSLGLTLSPPTLNWTVAAGVLSEAELRSSEMLCRQVSVTVERVIAVDKLIGVDMRNELREVEGEERRVRERRWREEEVVRRDKEDEERKEQHSSILAAIQQNKAQVDAARSTLLQQRYIEWRYRDERVEAEEMEDDQRLARYDVYHASQLRISLNRQEESAAWKNEWRTIQLLQQQRLAEERAAALARQQAEQQRINAAYTAARLKAKQGRLQLTIVRAKPLITPFLPPNTVAYFVAQLVTDPPTHSLDYPAPLSELRYTPFIAEVSEEGEGREEGVEVSWSGEWAAKSVGKTTLVLGWQCCDREQKERFDKWIRKKERQRRKNAVDTTTTTADQQQQPTNTRPAKATKGKLPIQKHNNNKPAPTASNRPNRAATTSTEQQVSAVKQTKKLKELRSHSHRHKVITRVLELGRVEFRLRDVREREEGEWKGMVEVSGVSWQAKVAADERKRRRKRGRRRSVNERSEGEGGDDIDSPGMLSPAMLSPRPATGASSVSTDSLLPAAVTERTGAGLSKAERDNQRLAAAHLTMNPTSLYPSRLREKRSELQLLLMTEKERQQYVEEEERKERMRREKEDKERRKWSRKVGEVWFELKLLPLDADGKLVVREGEKRVEGREREEGESEVNEVDEEEAEKEEGEDAEEGEVDEDEVEDEEEEDDDEKAIAKKSSKSRAAQQKSVSKRDKHRGQTGNKSSRPQTEYLSQEQLRAKAFPVMD